MEWTGDLDGVEVLEGSVTEPERWTGDPRINQLGGVVHLAAIVRHSRRRPTDVYRTNVDGTVALARVAAARGCRMVLVSTSGTVGCFLEPGTCADDDAAYCENLVARWPYYHSKILAERRARGLVDELGLDLVIVRPPVVLGPGDHRFRSTGHLVRFLEGRLPFVVRGGMHFADVRDVAHAILRAAEPRTTRRIYNLPGTASEIRDFFALVAELAGVPAVRRVLPFRLAWGLATMLRPLGVLPDPVVIEIASHYWNTTSRYAAADLGYASRDPRQTLTDTIAWLRANHPGLAGSGAR